MDENALYKQNNIYNVSAVTNCSSLLQYTYHMFDYIEPHLIRFRCPVQVFTFEQFISSFLLETVYIPSHYVNDVPILINVSRAIVSYTLRQNHTFFLVANSILSAAVVSSKSIGPSPSLIISSSYMMLALLGILNSSLYTAEIQKGIFKRAKQHRFMNISWFGGPGHYKRQDHSSNSLCSTSEMWIRVYLPSAP